MFSIVVYCTGLNVKINCQLILLTLNFAKLTTVFNLNSDIVKKIDQSEFVGELLLVAAKLVLLRGGVFCYCYRA